MIGTTNQSSIRQASVGRRIRSLPSTTPVHTRRVVANSFLETFINQVTEAIANSPLNEGKIKLAVAQAGNYDEAAIQQQMKQLADDNPVLMYSFSTCPFCMRAKELLDSKGVTYKVLELNEMGQEGMAYRAELGKATKRTSMPNVFIGGTSVGGCNDGPGVMTLDKQGKLDAMLKEAMGGTSAAAPTAEAPAAPAEAAPEAAPAEAAPEATPEAAPEPAEAPVAAAAAEEVDPKQEAREWIAKWKARVGKA